MKRMVIDEYNGDIDLLLTILAEVKTRDKSISLKMTCFEDD